MRIRLNLRQFLMAGSLAAVFFILWQNSWPWVIVVYRMDSTFTVSVIALFLSGLFFLWCRLSGTVFITAKDPALIWQWRRIDFGVLIGTLLASFAYRLFK